MQLPKVDNTQGSVVDFLSLEVRLSLLLRFFRNPAKIAYHTAAFRGLPHI
jgi:hypothetical protein